MRPLVIATLLLGLTFGCQRGQEFELVGQVLAVQKDRREITVRHQDIRGFMPGMTMPFKVRDVRLLDAAVAGDLIKARLVVEPTEAYLATVERTGHAPIAEDPMTPAPPPEILEIGADVPDAAFVDQTGAPRRLADWRGRLLALTFIYTRCPLPEFCPRMNRNFAAVQATLQKDAGLRDRVRLLSISFDPDFDTPAVLAAHARQAGADPGLWTFVTGAHNDVERFATRFGVSLVRDDPTEIGHNLRTVVIGADGRLVTILRGNEWTSDELTAVLRNAR